MIVTFKDPALFVGNLKACLLAVSPDEARPISCIRLECGGSCTRFIATNGHWLWVNEIWSSAEGEDAVVLLSVEDAKRIVKFVDTSKKASGLAVELDTEKRTVRQLVDSLAYGEVGKVFPSYEMVVPATVGGGRIIACFDARLMQNVAAAFSAAACTKGDVPLLFHTTEPHAPIVITGCKAASVADAVVVLMPCRYDVGGPDALLSRYRQRKVPS